MAETQYKIGTMAKLLGISSESLRYYENCGILSPHKDAESGYRSYGPWDFNTLFLCRLYRSYGFSLSEVKEMLNEDNKDDLYDRLLQQETQLLNLIRHYQNILYFLSRHRQKLMFIDSYVGHFRVTKNPEMLMLCTGTAVNSSVYTASFLNDNKVANTSLQWLQTLPGIALSFRLLRHPLESGQECDFSLDEIDDREYSDTLWGYTALLSEAEQLGLKPDPPVEYIPSKRCVHTVFAAGEKGTLHVELDKQVLQPLRKLGYELLGTVLGRTIAYVRKDEKLIRYYDVWVPIQ